MLCHVWPHGRSYAPANRLALQPVIKRFLAGNGLLAKRAASLPTQHRVRWPRRRLDGAADTVPPDYTTAGVLASGLNC